MIIVRPMYFSTKGNLWGKKRVAIAIDTVTSVDNGVQLNLTKDEVGYLPPVEPADEG